MLSKYSSLRKKKPFGLSNQNILSGKGDLFSASLFKSTKVIKQF